MSATELRRTGRRAAAGLLLVAVLSGCTDPETTSAPTDPPATTPEHTTEDEGTPAEEDVTAASDAGVGMGEPVEGGRFELRVEDFTCDTEPDPAAGADVEERRCELTVAARNDSDIEQSIDTRSILLLDDAGTEYAPTEATTQDGDMDAVEPGGAATVVLTFDVPGTATIVAARLGDDPDAEGTLVDLVGG